MYRFLLAAVDVVPAAIVLVPVFLILHWTVYHRNLRKSILYCLFSLYLAAVFALVGIPNITYIRVEMNLNLIPFWGMAEDFHNSILNILLFIPLGIFLPVLNEQFRRKQNAIAFGFGMSLLIELLQIFTFRATDVNDLITNVSGTLVGFLIADHVIARFSVIWDAVNGKRTKELYLVWIMTFFVMFFIHPFLSPLIWDGIL